MSVVDAVSLVALKEVKAVGRVTEDVDFVDAFAVDIAGGTSFASLVAGEAWTAVATAESCCSTASEATASSMGFARPFVA